MSDEVGGGQSLSRLQHYASYHDFTPLRTGYSEDCRFADCRMLVNDRLDFTGVNIFATGDNHVLQAVQDVEIAVRILIAKVACAKKPISECARGFVRIVPIAAHDVGAPSYQFTLLSALDLLACLIHHLHINSETRASAGQELIVSVFLVLQTGEKAGFAQSVDLNEFEIREKLSDPVDQFRRHRRSAVSQYLDTAEVIFPDFRKLGQQIDHGWHQNGVTDAFAFYGLAEGLRAEFRNRDLESPERRGRQHSWKVSDVEDRRRE